MQPFTLDIHAKATSRARQPGVRLLAALGLIGTFLLSGQLPAQIVPDAPVENFRLPMFDDQGHRIWDLRGAEAHFISEDRIDVIGMNLRVFSGGEDERVRSRIQSPEATVFIDRNEARGDRSIEVTGDNYRATGKSWSWMREANRIVIDEEVEVTFFEELEGFLMPLP